MKIEVCDLCGTIYGLPHRLKLYEPVHGCLLAELTICQKCGQKLERHIKNRKERIIVHFKEKVKEFFKQHHKENNES